MIAKFWLADWFVGKAESITVTEKFEVCDTVPCGKARGVPEIEPDDVSKVKPLGSVPVRLHRKGVTPPSV